MAETQLFEACEKGEVAVVFDLVEHGADVNARNGVGRRAALHGACCVGNEEIVDFLLAHGADVDSRDSDGFTPLMVASEKGRRSVCEKLLRRGAAVDAVSDRVKLKLSPFLLAAENGHTDVVSVLLAAGANPRQVDLHGFNALSLACSKGHAAVVDLLLRAGVPSESPPQAAGVTPLFLASRGGFSDIVKMLIRTGFVEDGPPDSTASHSGNPPEALLLSSGPGSEDSKCLGLIEASSEGHVPVVELLLRNGVSVDSPGKQGKTALHVACRKCKKAVVRTLLSAHADPNKRGEHAETPLHEAAHAGDREIIEALLSAGADKEARDDQNRTPLAVACAAGQLLAIEVLLLEEADAKSVSAVPANETAAALLAMFDVRAAEASGINTIEKVVNALSKQADRFVFDAVALGCPLSRLKTALFAGGKVPPPEVFASIDPTTFDPDTRDDAGETVLHWAARCSDASTVASLVAAGFDPNAREFTSGRTPLFMASKAAAMKLLELGASRDVVDISGLGVFDSRDTYLLLPPSRDRSQPSPTSTKSIPDGLSKKLHVVTAAIVGAEFIRSDPRHSISESLILGSTLGATLGPTPSRGVSRGDCLRPERFSFSQRRLPFEGDGEGREPVELPILWTTTGRDADHHLCVRLGDVGWFRSPKLSKDVELLIFVHNIGDPSGIARLPQLVQDVRQTGKFEGAAFILLGIGEEVREDKKRMEELARARIHVLSAAQCRAVARHSRFHGFVECRANPAAYRDAVLRCVGAHLATIERLIGSAKVTSPFALSPHDKSVLGHPLSDREVEVREVKMLLLGHASTGKTTLLRRIREQDTRKKSFVKRMAFKIGAMAQPMSTVGIDFEVLSNFTRKARLRVLDFAGQIDYSNIHEQFLSSFNAIYVVAVSAASETRISQLRFWLHMLSTVSKGPMAGSALLVVATMADLVPGGPETVQARHRELKEEVDRWGISRQALQTAVIVVSSQTGQGLVTVFYVLKEMAKKIGATKIPHSFKVIQDELPNKARDSHVVFLTIPEIKPMVKSEEIRSEIERHDAWDDVAQHLHDCGIAVWEPTSSTVCIDIDVLAKLMSVFIAPDVHLARLLDTQCVRSDIVSRKDAIQRMQQVKGISSSALGQTAEIRQMQCERAIEFMQHCGLCFAMTPEEDIVNHGRHGLMFPSLRVAVDVISVPFRRLSAADPHERVVGARLRSSRREIGTSTFFRTLVSLRPLIDPGFKIFSNCVILRDPAHGNRMLLALRTCRLTSAGSGAPAPSTLDRSDGEENEIIVVSQGHSPEMWRDSIGTALLATADICDALCPVCIRSDSFNVLASTANPGVMKCDIGHETRSADASKGITIDSAVLRRNKLWSPAFGEAFFKAEPDKWKSEGRMRITVLTEDEQDPARQAQYLWARTAFYRFIGADNEQTIALSQIEFIQNDQVEAGFEKFFDGLVQRVMLRNQSEFDALKSGFVGPAASSFAGEDEEKQEWRIWVLRQLEKSVMHVSGNEGLNVILAWHGSSEESIRRIAESGFLEPRDLAAAGVQATDPGFFGPGIYLTQSPSCGAHYASLRKSNCLLLSWALMGSVYPVIESPGALKARVEPFDSHYVVVDKVRGNPIKSSDPPGNDEIVLFSKNQVLPRAIFHFRSLMKAQPSPMTPVNVAEDLKDARPILLWIDPDFRAIEHWAVTLRQALPRIGIAKCMSTAEANIFLGKNGRLFMDRIAVVTNRSRDGDGGDRAWERAIEVTRAHKLNIRVIVYCSKDAVGTVSAQAAGRSHVTVTADPAVLLAEVKKV